MKEIRGYPLSQGEYVVMLPGGSTVLGVGNVLSEPVPTLYVLADTSGQHAPRELHVWVVGPNQPLPDSIATWTYFGRVSFPFNPTTYHVFCKAELYLLI